jgi:5-methylcytosine-specific restriction protein B
MLDSELSAELAKDAKKRMIRLNKAIWDEKENKGIEGLNEAYHIGASYFLKLKNYESDSDNGFQSLWEYHIKGILQEYLRGSGNEAKIAELKAAYDREEE